MAIKKPSSLNFPLQKQLAYAVNIAAEYISAHQLHQAEGAYRQALRLAPHAPELHNNLGTVLKEQGRIDEARAAFQLAIALRPNYAAAHSNLLFTLQYAPGQTLANLSVAHTHWFRQQCRGITSADLETFPRKEAGPIVVGLVSPDLYAHPVGVFLLPWLENHDRSAFRLIAYSDSQRDDPIASRIRYAVDDWRVIAGHDDATVAKLVADDQIDILIDLAGHTAGNRLKLFARRVAPVQVNWLGYSATTGVPAMDAVLMDAYTAPQGVEAHFTERLLRIKGLRFCYTAPSYAPAVSPTPAQCNGHITFGSFNNLAKITSEVIETWAAILKAVPNARLILKWKSLGDAETRKRLISVFSQHGVDGARIECRGWSSHQQMLAQYGDIDIALDPFPFSGGLTSCDSLFMGVPVVTLPSELPISRQTASFLDALGLQDLIAITRDEYISKAMSLAKSVDLLITQRRTLRTTIVNSLLCDGTAYSRAIETALSELHLDRHRTVNSKNKEITMKTFLHAGCGPKRKDRTTKGLNTPEWTEIRLDIDASVAPDVIGTMTEMSAVATASVDSVYSSHNIEHLYPHEVQVALSEFLRVLKPDGFIVVTCPDLRSVCALIAEDKLTETAYTSPAGPIAPIDILYGLRSSMAQGNLYMAHRCGFTQKVLSATLQAAGFKSVACMSRGYPYFDLWAVASKEALNEEQIKTLAVQHMTPL
jgi:protein O-GlcNAc transferase